MPMSWPQAFVTWPIARFLASVASTVLTWTGRLKKASKGSPGRIDGLELRPIGSIMQVFGAPLIAHACRHPAQ
jgi:hypothetical protein